jgi:RNA polymerase sigma-70 factor (ECF subfamily)
MDDLKRAARAAARGDRQALSFLVGATQDDVWRLCAHLTDPASADDLVREAYRRAVSEAGRLRPGAAVRAWLLAIAYRVCAEQAESRDQAGPAADRPAASAEHDGRGHGDTALPLAGLAPARRGAFVLTQLLGCSYAEAAEISGCPASVIRSRVARARDDLGALIAAGPAICATGS